MDAQKYIEFTSQCLPRPDASWLAGTWRVLSVQLAAGYITDFRRTKA